MTKEKIIQTVKRLYANLGYKIELNEDEVTIFQKFYEEILSKLQLPSDDPLKSFESFVDQYPGDRLFPKTTFKEDYAGGSREYIQLEIVQDWLKSKLQ